MDDPHFVAGRVLPRHRGHPDPRESPRHRHRPHGRRSGHLGGRPLGPGPFARQRDRGRLFGLCDLSWLRADAHVGRPGCPRRPSPRRHRPPEHSALSGRRCPAAGVKIRIRRARRRARAVVHSASPLGSARASRPPSPSGVKSPLPRPFHLQTPAVAFNREAKRLSAAGHNIAPAIGPPPLATAHLGQVRVDARPGVAALAVDLHARLVDETKAMAAPRELAPAVSSGSTPSRTIAPPPSMSGTTLTTTANPSPSSSTMASMETRHRAAPCRRRRG